MPEPGDFKHLDYRLATKRDVPSMITLFAEFFSESTLPKIGLVLDYDKATAWLTRVIETGSSPHIIAVDKSDNVVVGTVNYVIDNDVTEQPFACLDKFYVSPSWRTRGVAQVLLQLLEDAAQGDGAVALRAGLSAGIPGAQALFERSGFRVTPHSVMLEKEL